MSALETWATERLWDASRRIQDRCPCFVGGKAHRGGYSDGLGIAISFQLCFTKGGPRLDPKGKVVYNVTT